MNSLDTSVTHIAKKIFFCKRSKFAICQKSVKFKACAAGTLTTLCFSLVIMTFCSCVDGPSILKNVSVIETKTDRINVVICGDNHESNFYGMMVTINSLVKNASPNTRKRLFVYFVVAQGQRDLILKFIRCYFPSAFFAEEETIDGANNNNNPIADAAGTDSSSEHLSFIYSVIEFEESIVTAPRVIYDNKGAHLSSALNYARFYIHKMLPGVDKVLVKKKNMQKKKNDAFEKEFFFFFSHSFWTTKKKKFMDGDLLIYDDIGPLYDEFETSDSSPLFSATPRRRFFFFFFNLFICCGRESTLRKSFL